MKNSINSQGPIYILRQVDEMQMPYENALLQISNEVRWFTSVASLLKTSSQNQPTVAIIDIDAIREPLEPTLEQIRSHFAQTDLIALSTFDSSQIALACLRFGFVDFFIKPLSPEELAWSTLRCLQRQDIFQRLKSPQARFVKAVTQISNCTTPTLVRIYTLEYLKGILKSATAAWIEKDKKEYKVICSIPKTVDQSDLQKNLSILKSKSKNNKFIIQKNTKTKKISIAYQLKNLSNSYVLLLGVESNTSKLINSTASIILEYSEMSLLNLQKFEEIKKQTFLDDLTGLYNSRYLKYAITNSILRCKKLTDKFSVLFIDIDHFKTINDKNGHLVGSEFLVAIGRTIRNAIRNLDPVFRYGGDEFVVLLNDMGTTAAKEIAERIRKNIERRVFVIQGVRLQATVSIGVACFPEHANEKDTLLKLADEAMYSAKKHSRNAVHLAYGLEEKMERRKLAVVK